MTLQLKNPRRSPRREPPTKPFKKTGDQRDACELLNTTMHPLLVGGSRSGKTTIAVRNIVLRAHKKSSRHLLCRSVFNHAKTSLWHDTIPKVMKLCFDGGKYTPKFNKADWYIENKVGYNQTSQIWLGGTDSKERVEKILGNEYSTIYANECSQIVYGAITTLRTRLAENSGLDLRFYYDANPPSKKHWTYQEFIEKKVPVTHELSQLETGVIFMNPEGNRKNLPTDYIDKILETLPKRERERFLLGKFQSEVEGALWTDEMVSWANSMPIGKAVRTIVAVDPSTTDNPGSDECGIVICSIDENGKGVIEADRTVKGRPSVWAKAVVKAYHDYNCNYVVAESNQGGELVTEVISKYQGDTHIKVKLVHAAKGKYARAEPVSVLYEQGEIGHRTPLLELEEEYTEWVPPSGDKDAPKTQSSPNRLDAAVWGMTDLFKLNKQVHIG